MTRFFALALAFVCLLIPSLGCGSAGPLLPGATGDYLTQGDMTFSAWPPEIRDIPFYVAPNDSLIPGVDPVKAVVAGFHDWNDALSPVGRRFVRVATESDAVVVVRWEPLDSILGGELGYTVPQYGPRSWAGFRPKTRVQELRRVTVTLGRGMLPHRFRPTASHEAGHALGVQGHSRDSRDLMAPKVPIVSGPQPRDIHTVQAVYRLVPTEQAE
jgi:hypothetical protein